MGNCMCAVRKSKEEGISSGVCPLKGREPMVFGPGARENSTLSIQAVSQPC